MDEAHKWAVHFFSAQQAQIGMVLFLRGIFYYATDLLALP